MLRLRTVWGWASPSVASRIARARRKSGSASAVPAARTEGVMRPPAEEASRAEGSTAPRTLRAHVGDGEGGDRTPTSGKPDVRKRGIYRLGRTAGPAASRMSSPIWWRRTTRASRRSKVRRPGPSGLPSLARRPSRSSRGWRRYSAKLPAWRLVMKAACSRSAARLIFSTRWRSPGRVFRDSSEVGAWVAEGYRRVGVVGPQRGLADRQVMRTPGRWSARPRRCSMSPLFLGSRQAAGDGAGR